VKAVIAKSFERIQRANLVGRSVLPLQWLPGSVVPELIGDETVELFILADGITPQQAVRLRMSAADGRVNEGKLRLRVDTPFEVEHLKHGGILPCVLRQLLQMSA
jgi:aconitate hydratase